MRESRTDRLRALLQVGDPAGEPGPGFGELARMRETVLAAAAAAPRSTRLAGVPAPVLAAAALAAVAVLAAGAWLGRSGPVAVLPTESPRASAAWSPSAPEPAAFEAPPPPAAAGPALPREQREAPSPLRATTVRFTTRRGTQIIWTLDPRNEL